MGDQVSTSPQYYNELVPDPKNKDRVYAMDTWMMVTDDGGKTWSKVGEKFKHVDNHALWIDPENTDHLIAGCDGGLYESFDRAATWAFTANLPITQFYRVAVDNDAPAYNVCGGTQDNYTLCGPSRTLTTHGIRNSDWFVTTGGDGFQPRIDPTDPNIVYAESQHGGLVRFDRKTGEQVDIQPQPAPGEAPLRWNWDSPLIISPHSHTRLYFAAQRVFRSDDRGDTWTPISGDLTAQIDRNKLPVMGRVWSVDAVAKNASTSFYGNIVSLAESPKKEGLLYAGTDDGLVQVTEDGGGTWRKIASFPGVPAQTYVSYLFPSWFDSERRLRGLRQPQARRLHALPPPERRPGRDLDLDRGRPAGARHRLRDRAGLREARPALRRHRVRPLLHARRRQEVGAAEGRPADDRGARPGDPAARERPGARHLRARLLRPRRLLRAAARLEGVAREGSRPLPGQVGGVLRAGGTAGAQGEVLPGRGLLRGSEPPVRRGRDVLPEGRDQEAAAPRARRRRSGRSSAATRSPIRAGRS